MAERLRAAFSLPRAFVAWWLGELAGLFPASLIPSAPNDRPGLILYIMVDEIVLIQRRAREGEIELLRVASSVERGHSIAAVIDAFSLLAEPDYEKLPIVVRFAGSLGMRRLIELPLAARDSLQQLLKFELDRLTPFKTNDVYFSWRIESTDSKAGRMEVALEIAPKILLDEAVGLVEAHGRAVDRVELERTDFKAEPLDLLPTGNRKKPASLWHSRWLKIVILLLLIFSVSLTISRQVIIISELEGELSAVRGQAEESLALQKKLTSLSEQASFLHNTREANSTMTEMIAELTRLIPVDSHILQLTIAEGTIDLTGYSEKASDVLTVLDQSPMFEAPRFRSPVTRDERSNKERFQIAVDIAGRLP